MRGRRLKKLIALRTAFTLYCNQGMERMLPRIYVDFQKTDDEGRLRLVCVGTRNDIAQQGVVLREGLQVLFYCDDVDDQENPDDLEVMGKVTFDSAQNEWLGIYDPSQFRHASDRRNDPNA
jgi:hypothetical protein